MYLYASSRPVAANHPFGSVKNSPCAEIHPSEPKDHNFAEEECNHAGNYRPALPAGRMSSGTACNRDARVDHTIFAKACNPVARADHSFSAKGNSPCGQEDHTIAKAENSLAAVTNHSFLKKPHGGFQYAIRFGIRLGRLNHFENRRHRRVHHRHAGRLPALEPRK